MDVKLSLRVVIYQDWLTAVMASAVAFAGK